MHPKNIYPESVEEVAIVNLIEKNVKQGSRQMQQDLIKEFGFERNNNFTPFETYHTYDSWFNDPSIYTERYWCSTRKNYLQ